YGQSHVPGDGVGEVAGGAGAGAGAGGGGGGGSGAGGGAGGGSSSQKLTTNDALTYLKEVKDMFHDQREKYDMFLDVMKDFKAQRYIKFVSHFVLFIQVAALFDDQPDLLDEFTRFLPDASAAATAHLASLGRHSYHRYDERSSAMATFKQPQMDKHRGRRDRIIASHAEQDLSVERRDIDEDDKTMKLQKEQRKRSEKESRDRRNCDQDYKETDLDTNRDMHRSEKRKSACKVEDFGVHSGLAPYGDKDALKSMYSQEFTFCEKVKDRLRNHDDYQAFLKCLHIYSTSIITRKELQSLVSDLLGKHPDLMEGFSAFLERCENIDGFLAGVMEKKSLLYDGHVSKSTRTEDKEREHRREIDAAKEDRYKEKYWAKSIQELDLSDCQRCTPSYRLLPDDYPIPSVSQRSELGTQVLNDLWVSVTSVLNLRCMERLYGDHGLDVMETLRRNPSAALPVMLTRLKQKQEEWTKCRADLNKVWADIYAKNHYKSLDHRSFYFKQQDSKNLSTKSLVAEIREIKGKSQKDDDVLNSIAAGSRHSVMPNLEFEYTDNDIHEDAFKLIRYSCEEICTSKEQLNKVLGLWTTFLEPILGVPSRPFNSGRFEDARGSIKNVGTSAADNNGSPGADGGTANTKQSKPSCNGDDCISPDRMHSRKHVMVNGDTSAKEDGFQAEKEVKNVGIKDSGSEIKKSAMVTRITDSGLGTDIVPCRTSMEPGNVTENGHEAKSNIDEIPVSQYGDIKRSVTVANGTFAEVGKVKRYNENSAEPSKAEKEEGELSPNVDFDEVNNPHYRFGGQEVRPDVGGEIEADADDEDSENVSEAGDEASGSESAADECSREERDEDGDRDDRAESEGEAEGIEDANFVSGDGMYLPPSEHFLRTAKPLAKCVASSSSAGGKRDYRVFYGNDAFYTLFRLHQVLYDRLLSAKLNSISAEARRRTAKDTCPPDLYSTFMTSLYNLLDGVSDNARFEDDCRAIFGNQSYVLFTLDKLIYKLVKQLYEYERSRKPEKFVDSVYYENAHVVLHDENIYRFQCSSGPSRLTIQLMDDGIEKPEVVAVSVDPNFAAYLDKDFLSVVTAKKEAGIMMQRSKRKYSGLDESSAQSLAMDGAHVISYVLDTEDFFFRERRKRRKLSGGRSSSSLSHTNVERFHRFLAASIAKL
ncbi:Histone deacetylase interacting, partial [Cynara cardunculus var. scolymus]